jgi:hypothetical protein
MFGIERSIQCEENIPAALVRRRLAGPPLDDGAEFHLLQIDLKAGAAQLVGTDQAERAHAAEFGGRYDNGRLAAVTGLDKLLIGRRRIAGPPQDLDPGVVGEWRAVREEANAVQPIRRVGAGDAVIVSAWSMTLSNARRASGLSNGG